MEADRADIGDILMNLNKSKQCPYCAETILADAVKCRFCGSTLERDRFLQGWTRKRRHGKIAGVCSGLAVQFALPVTILRLAFIVLTFFGGWGIVIYLALWFIMPDENDGPTSHAS